ncbi:MAG: succinate dehydrogenase [Candidatus Marinimicrobia bacterium]|nr:succinate dehydrogenase [Candidatus Neomarinimicrobiota bacterium]
MKFYILNKYLASLSGLFLLLFLTGHLAGNLQLLISESAGAQKQFNEYANFMSTNPVVKVLSIITYVSIFLHVFVTIVLTIDSKMKRPIKYKKTKSPSSSPGSKYMGVLGTIILAFVIIHLSNFWFKAKFTNEILKDPYGNKDIYSLVISKFQHIEHVSIYVFSMLAIFFHTLHGFSSSFQSLGLVTSKTRKYFTLAGIIYSLVIPVMFAVIPVYIYFGLNK